MDISLNKRGGGGSWSGSWFDFDSLVFILAGKYHFVKTMSRLVLVPQIIFSAAAEEYKNSASAAKGLNTWMTTACNGFANKVIQFVHQFSLLPPKMPLDMFNANVLE